MTPNKTNKQTGPTDISFLIADLRWNKGTLKILELGEGPQSFFQGFDELFGKGQIWQSFWRYLKQLHLPMWYVGKKPLTIKKINQFAFDEFLAHGGRWVSSLKVLTQDDVFKNIIIRPYPTAQHRSIKQHRGILIFSNHGYPNWYAQDLKEFKKKHAGFLIINDIATPHVNHKYHTSLLFDNELSTYRPRWIRCQKKYTPQLTHHILNHLQSPRVVIKPLNAANGWGNVMVEAQDLDATLKKIITQSQELKACNDPSWSYWAYDGHAHFLVEEFVTSHPIKINNKHFDGTMRVVFVLTHEQGTININFLGYCWKLPRVSLDKDGSLMEKHKSGYGAARVCSEDKKQIEPLLKNVLWSVYKKMLSKKQEL